ncbi:hypothetical protein [Nonomuraea guangzhouensis]|uniref:hypothetical protein n=1 Tax=Nonomuraea guangzhouensis TaxID=1291555 RepID=UPI001C5E67FD|nr:hypothetical protein [Nonomuraea guangzhouensis]
MRGPPTVAVSGVVLSVRCPTARAAKRIAPARRSTAPAYGAVVPAHPPHHAGRRATCS